MSMRVVIAGGGVAALEGALALRALAEERVTLELVAPEPHFWYRPLAVAEAFGLGEVQRFPLVDLASAVGADLTVAELVGVNAARHTAETSHGPMPYDALLIACGALPSAGVPGALTFRGPADIAKIGDLLGELDAGTAHRIGFVLPWGATWSLPLYELVLMTAAFVSARRLNGVELTLVTPEEAPLELFGPAGSDAMGRLLEDANVTVRTGSFPAEFVEGELHLIPRDSVPLDRVVALARLRGPRLDGLPQTVHGFVPVDAHGRVPGLPDVYAAGDVTSSFVKQGGIAAQQADAAAEAIAAAAGADVTPRPFRAVLRGLLLTGGEPRYLEHELARGDEGSSVSPEPLWWPPAKIVGHYLAPFLADRAGLARTGTPPAPSGAVAVEVEVDAARAERLGAPRVETPVPHEDLPVVGEVMSEAPLVVAPEDTLGEVAEQLRTLDVGSAVVADFGRVVGILTSRDLVRAFAGRVHASEARVREWMTAEPVTVSPETSVGVAVTLMTEYGIHHLPVVEDGRAVGMVGFRQAARAARRAPAVGLGL